MGGRPARRPPPAAAHPGQLGGRGLAQGPHPAPAGPGGLRAVHRAHQRGRGRRGQRVLALALGIVDPAVIAPEGDGDASATVNKIVTFAPHEDAGRIRDAMTAAAPAGSATTTAAFTVEGEGRFRPLDGATPAVGRVGEVEVVAESRIEAVVPRDRRDAVVAALRAVHPYEEPRPSSRHAPAGRPTGGTAGSAGWPSPPPCAASPSRCAVRCPSPHGVRVAGDPDRPVETVAVTSGAGDFLLDTVLGTGADVYVTSDLRHHRAGSSSSTAGPPWSTWRTGRRSGRGCRSWRGSCWKAGRARGYGGHPREHHVHRPVDLPPLEEQ